MDIPLTLYDIIFAAVWAFIGVCVIKWVPALFMKFVVRTTIFAMRPDVLSSKELEAIEKNVCRLFPIESLSWQGITFHRGNILRIITSDEELIEGKFMGINDKNIACLITGRNIVAYGINTIDKIQKI